MSLSKHILIRFLQGIADDGERQQVDRWLARSARNRKEMCRMLELWDGVKWMTEDEILRSWDKMLRRIESADAAPAQPQNLPNPTRRQARRWMSYAAAAAVAGVVAMTGWQLFSPEAPQESVPTEVVECRYGEGRLRYVLPDSSVVWLHEGSRISFSQRFTEPERMVQLSGVAYFEVAKDKAHPFIVQTGNTQVEVTGTSFEVDAAAVDSINVTLVTGGIDVTTTDSAGEELFRNRLTPGHQASIARHDGQMRIHRVETAFYEAWKTGVYRFTNETFAQIARQMSWQFGVKVKMSASLAGQRFTGRIMPAHSVEDVLENFKAICPFKYRKAGNTFIIKKL